MPVAIITGASRGLGRAVAHGLAGKSWKLVIDARGQRALDAVTAQLARETTVVGIAGDVADHAHRRALVAAAASLGGLDLLVNNASVLGPSPQPRLAAYPIDVLHDVFDVNVVAPLALAQQALPHLRVSGTGTIVNITSDASIEAYESWGGYGSSKAALDQLGNILGAEEPDVRVYTFDPGDMRTQMHQDAFPGEDISDRPEPESVVPAVLRLLDERPASGRYRASEFLAVSS
jgi:NAD(P)-dependent dehydrogenase (short-subunit alcohol dehydrogenase family)